MRGFKMGKTTFKTSKTIKDYHAKLFGYSFIVPKGSIVNNHTAMGCNDNYRFLTNFNEYDLKNN